MQNKNAINFQVTFQIYGVKICLETDDSSVLEGTQRQLAKIFTNGYEILKGELIDHRFYIKSAKNEILEFFHNDEKLFEGLSDETFYEAVESRVRVTVAEFAEGKVFLHAGVIGWNDRAILIPGQSWSGKTTLVSEFVKKGALYYSDEYAVLDADGNVEPFPKWLSVRGIIDDYRQVDVPIESIGGTAGTKTIPVGMILIAQFDKNHNESKFFEPEYLTAGQGIMEILPHTLPVRNRPKFVFEVLNKLTTRAIIVKTVRGEAKEFADLLLNYFEDQAD